VIYLVTNEPERPQQEIRIRWPSASPMILYPQAVDLGVLRPGEIKEARLTLRPRTVLIAEKPEEIPAGIASRPMRSAISESAGEISTEITSEGEYRVTLTAGKGVGSHRATMIVDQQQGRSLEADVNFEVRPNLSVEPSLLGHVASDDSPWTTELRIVNETDRPTKLEKIECEPRDWLKGVQISPAADDEDTVKVTLRSPVGDRPVTGTLRLVVDHGGEQRTFEVPITVVSLTDSRD